MAMMEIKKRKQEEYEMQLFGFHSRAVEATLKSLIQEKIQSRCQKLSESLKNKYKPEGDYDGVLQKNVKKLMDAYNLGLRTHLSAIENCMGKLISIPQYVLINDDKIQANQFTDENFFDMRRKLENLQHRLRKAIIINTILKEEMVVIEQFYKNINRAKESCDIIDDGIKYPDVNTIMITLMGSHTGLQSYFDKLDDPHVFKNGERYVTCIKKSEDNNLS